MKRPMYMIQYERGDYVGQHGPTYVKGAAWRFTKRGADLFVKKLAKDLGEAYVQKYVRVVEDK